MDADAQAIGADTRRRWCLALPVVTIISPVSILPLALAEITLIPDVPTDWVIATRPALQRSFRLLLNTIPFWTNLLVRALVVQKMNRCEVVFNRLFLWQGLIDALDQGMSANFAVLFGVACVFLKLMILPVYATIEKGDFRMAEARYRFTPRGFFAGAR